MIIVQDRIEVSAANLAAVQQLMMGEYRTGAQARGLVFDEVWVSPPVATDHSPLILSLRWHVDDAPSWWAMRAQSGTPENIAFWHKIDELCIQRERSYGLTVADAAICPGDDLSAFQVTTRAYRETAQLDFKETLDQSDKTALLDLLGNAADALPGVERVHLAENMAPDYAAGDYTLDLLFDTRSSADAAHSSSFWQEQLTPALHKCCKAVHALELDTVAAGVRQPDIENAVKRTAFFRVLPGKENLAQSFENQLLDMPAHIPHIVNWRLSRASVASWNTAQCSPWTYVWEQEFRSLDDLLDPYMMHPHHWAYIDRWFDVESGVQAIDADLSHAFCTLNSSLISAESC